MANSTSPVPQIVEGSGAVAKINGLNDAGSPSFIGGRDDTSTLLNWKYLGGRFNGIDVANGFVTLTASTTNYVVMHRTTGAVSVATTTTNWNDSVTYWRLYSVVTSATTWTGYFDERNSATGLFGIGQVPVAGFSNPMTTAADIIVGGVSGAATRMAKGTAYQALRMNSGATAQEWASNLTSIPVACSDETTAISAGTAKVTFHMPIAMTLTEVMAGLTTVQTSGSIFTVDVKKNGTTIFTTKPTIDNTEATTLTAATAAVLSTPSLAKGDAITIDVTQIGDGTAKGLKIYLTGNLT